MNWNDQNLIKVLKQGGIVFMPTDTIYGIVGKADNPSTVDRIYNIRKRASNKPCVILIGAIDELKKFSVNLSKEQKKIMKKYWPGPVSVVFDCPLTSLKYLHRGTKTLAFRLPGQIGLRNLLKRTGPLIAPSANPEGLLPAQNISEAQKYFGNSIDLYINSNISIKKPSKIIKMQKDGSAILLRA